MKCSGSPNRARSRDRAHSDGCDDRMLCYGTPRWDVDIGAVQSVANSVIPITCRLSGSVTAPQPRVPVMRRSRSNIAEDPPAEAVEDQQHRGDAEGEAEGGVITLKAMSEVTATGGRLASMPSCWATRTSLERAEIAMPTQIDQPASSGVNTSWASRSGPCSSAEATAGGRTARPRRGRSRRRVGDRNRRDEGGQGLAQQQLLAADGVDEQRLEGALLPLADHRVGGERRRAREPG